MASRVVVTLMDHDTFPWRTSTEILVDGEPITNVVAALRQKISNIEKNELLSSSKLPEWMTQCFSDILSNADPILESQSLKKQFENFEAEVSRLRNDLLLLQSSSSTDPKTIPALQPPTWTDMEDGINPERKPNGSKVAEEITEVIDTTKLLKKMLVPLWQAVYRQSDEFMDLRKSFSDAKDTVELLQAELRRRDALTQARTSKSEEIVQSNIKRIEERLRIYPTRDELMHLENNISKQRGIDRQVLVEDTSNRFSMLDERFLVLCEQQENVNSNQAEKIQDLVRKLSTAESLLRQSVERQATIEKQLENSKNMITDLTIKLRLAHDEKNDMKQTVQSLLENQNSSKKMNATISEELFVHEMQIKSVEQELLDAINKQSDTAQNEMRRLENRLNGVLDQNIGGALQMLETVVDGHSRSITGISVKMESAQSQIDGNEKSSQLRLLEFSNSIVALQENTHHITENLGKASETISKNSDDTVALASDLSRLRAEVDFQVENLHKKANDLSLAVDQTVKASEFEMTAARQQLYHVEDFNAGIRSTLKALESGTEEKFQLQRQENQVLQDSISKVRTSHIQLCKQQEQFDSRITSFQTESRLTIDSSISELTKQLKKESERVEAFYYSYQSKQEEFANIVARSSIRNMTLTDLKQELDRVCEIFVSECWKFEISGRSNHQGIMASDNIIPSSSFDSARKLFNDRQQQLLVQNSQFFADLIVARAEYEALRVGCNKEVAAQADLSGLILSVQAAMADKLKAKVRFKIMHNKNIGEQFDAKALNRRELYITTLLNLLDATVRRRTLFGSSNESLTHTMEQNLESWVKTDHASTELAEARQQSQSSSLIEEAEPSNRSISSYIYRGGFRIPKGSGSVQRAPLHDRGSNEKYYSTELNGESCTMATSMKPFEGWISTENSTKTDEAVMAKSCSLPVLNPS